MSKETLSGIEDNNFTTCAICAVPYTTIDNSSLSVPKTLGCLHTFCKECLEKGIAPGASHIECFVCGIPTVLDTDQGVDSIKTNSILQSQIAALHLSSSASAPSSDSDSDSASASASASAGSPIVGVVDSSVFELAKGGGREGDEEVALCL